MRVYVIVWQASVYIPENDLTPATNSSRSSIAMMLRHSTMSRTYTSARFVVIKARSRSRKRQRLSSKVPVPTSGADGWWTDQPADMRTNEDTMMMIFKCYTDVLTVFHWREVSLLSLYLSRYSVSSRDSLDVVCVSSVSTLPCIVQFELNGRRGNERFSLMYSVL